MDKKILNENFSEEERKLLIFCYQISGTLNTIRRLKRKFPDNLEETYYNEYVEVVKKVYNVLKRAVNIFPDDERMKEWKDLIREIENEKLF